MIFFLMIKRNPCNHPGTCQNIYMTTHERNNVMANDNIQGVCFTAIQVGDTEMVDFWCHSLTGGSTDSIIVRVSFPNDLYAETAVEYAKWHPNRRTDKHTLGYKVDLWGTLIEFPTPEIASAMRSLVKVHNTFS
jgi:hypothetical protein